MKNNVQALEKQLKDTLLRWERLRDEGGSDPFWTDGDNMNLLREQMIYLKKQILDAGGVPEKIEIKVPPITDKKYMARREEIIVNAKKALDRMLSDENYRYTCKNERRMSPNESQKMNIGNIIGYVQRLQEAIDIDNVVEMRLFEKPDSYMESFSSCRKKMEDILRNRTKGNERQMDIFDFM
jgi:hypothetical protein